MSGIQHEVREPDTQSVWEEWLRAQSKRKGPEEGQMVAQCGIESWWSWTGVSKAES